MEVRGMFIKKLWKKLWCNHEFKTKTNLYGDMINRFSNHKMTVRSIQVCTKCGKIKYNDHLDPNCDCANDIY